MTVANLQLLTKMPPAVSRALSLFVKAVSKAYGDRLAGIYLFGSRARQESNSESDTDIAIVINGVVDVFAELETLSSIAYDVIVETSVDLRPVPLSESDWDDPTRHSNPAFVQAIKKDGVRLGRLGNDQRSSVERTSFS